MADSRKLLPLAEARPPLFVGVALEGSGFSVGVIDDLGRPLCWQTLAAQIDGAPEAAAGQIAAAVRRAIEAVPAAPSAVVRAGLALPGVIDSDAGMLVEAIRLRRWQRFPLRDRVSGLCGLPVALVNNADAAAYGEAWLGAGRRMRSLVLLTLGSGIGSGIIIGELAGRGGVCPSECGHMVIFCGEDARPCGCGQRGHLEAYASSAALVGRTEEALGGGRPSSLGKRLSGGAPLTAELVAAEAAAGDPLAGELVLDTARYLAIGIVSVMHTVDPSGVLLGGEMTFGGPASELGRHFLGGVREEVARRAFPLLARRTTIEFAALGGDAAALGAAGLARLESQAAG
jgi:glucokinase